jgi:cobalt-zinc-cadmium efflux system protein
MTHRDILQKKFRIFIWLSLFVLILELSGGFFTNSLALLSDSGHVLIDLLALLLAYFAMHLSKKGTTQRFTFGYYRAEILAAVANGVILIFLTLFIFYQAYLRFLSPQMIKGPEMFIIAIIGLFANLYIVIKMQAEEKENLNVRGAYLHVLADTVSSVGVVAAGLLITLTGNYIFDPLISALIGVFILISCLRLIKESTQILMEAVPTHIDLKKVSDDIQKIKYVKEVHDLHIWSIASDVFALSSHILIDAKDVNSLNNIVSQINEMLKSKYHITHSVIQSECEHCVDCSNNHCSLSEENPKKKI